MFKKVIDMQAIIRNIVQIKQHTSSKLCMVVKCDAYGHGLVKVALAVEELVDCFAVACVDEGVLLKKAGIKKDILIMGVVEPEEYPYIIEHDFIITIADYQHLMDMKAYLDSINTVNALNHISTNSIKKSMAKQHTKKQLSIDTYKQLKIRTHIKINSGLNRLGFSMSELDNIVDKIHACKQLELKGVYTHLGSPLDYTYTDNIIKEFIAKIDILKKKHNDIIIHASASNALYCKEWHLDMVRIGLACYGYIDCDIDINLINTMKVYGTIVAINKVKKYEFIGYVKGYQVPKDTTIAVVSGGYGDGLLRGVYKKARVAGEIVDIVGHISMDMFCVDLQGLRASIGDKVWLVDDVLRLDNIAKDALTIPYQLLTSLRPRAGVEYINV